MITQTKAAGRSFAVSRISERLAAARPFIVPIVVTLLVVVGAIFGPSALSHPGSGATPAGAHLEVGSGYLLLAPVFNVLDTLSLLTLGQHYAVLATLIGLYVLWRVLRSRTRRGALRRVGIEAAVVVASLAGLAAFYGFGIIGWRPMAALAVDDQDILILDLHSHTHHSHDGRDGFDAEANREWHESAGFHAAYISDHRTWQGYEDARPTNPARAGAGMTLLPALEILWAGKYANALGAPHRYRNAVEENHLIPDSLYRARRDGRSEPTLMLTIPSGLDGIPRHTADSIGYVAVEVNDAAPRGLRQSRREREEILRLADSLDLALVSGSNNHGMGRTAAAWTLMRIPGWRRMAPLELNAAIEAKLHAERGDATWVVERRVPYLGHSALALAPTLPAIVWQMFGGMGLGERVSWLLWAWALALAVMLVRERRRGRGEVRPAAVSPPRRMPAGVGTGAGS